MSGTVAVMCSARGSLLTGRSGGSRVVPEPVAAEKTVERPLLPEEVRRLYEVACWVSFVFLL